MTGDVTERMVITGHSRGRHGDRLSEARAVCLRSRCTNKVTPQKVRRGRPKRFCSDACRQAYARARAKEIKRNDWHTPSALAALARQMLGGIDLDPASSAVANATIQATAFYTPRQNGLEQPWFGRVFLNPPYGRHIPAWVAKLVAEHTSGAVVEALALIPARVDTRWFQDLYAFPICFLAGRLKFGKAANGALFPSALVYCGSEPERFAQVFEHLGRIVTAARRHGNGLEAPP